MTNILNEVDTPDAPAIEHEGEKVSGSPEQATPEEQAQPETGEELMPDEESKKEEMTGYNEHPDQEKVGGG